MYLFCAPVGAEVKANFSFAQERSFFLICVVATCSQGPQGTSAPLEFILFYLFSFSFFYPLQKQSTRLIHYNYVNNHAV